MIRFSRIAFAVLFALALLAPVPVEAASAVMCRAAAAGSVAGPGRWVAPASTTAYAFDNRGCAVIARADMGDAAAAGFTQSSAVRAIVYNVGVATSTTDFIIGSVPAGGYIVGIAVSNSVAAAITGGISIGTTANGTEVVTALTCGASCLTHVADSAMTKRVFSLTVATPLHAAAVTDWNSANATITVLYSYF